MAKDALAKILKEYDEYLSYGDTPKEYIYFPSSILGLNMAFGNVEGIRSGAIMQVIGETGRGKTTLSLEILANSQRKGILTDIKLPNGRMINAVFADFERTFDGKYAAKLGVDVSKVYVIRTPYAEQTFEILLALFEEGLKFAIVDSIAMIVPKAEEGKALDKDNAKVAAEAQALQRFLKLAVQHVYDANALLILINQYRANLSQMAMTDKKAYGARSIQYAMQISVDLTRITKIDKRMTIKAFVEKTKQGAGGKVAHFDLIQGAGSDRALHTAELAAEHEVLEKGGSWYYYPTKANATHKANGKGQVHLLPIDEIEAKLIEVLKQSNESEDEEE